MIILWVATIFVGFHRFSESTDLSCSVQVHMGYVVVAGTSEIQFVWDSGGYSHLGYLGRLVLRAASTAAKPALSSCLEVRCILGCELRRPVN